MHPDVDTIQFADSLPTRSRDDLGVASGVYAVRSRQTSSINRVSSFNKDLDPEAASQTVEEEYAEKEQVVKGWQLLWLAYQSTGVIYGDIGTSPLYVYSSVFSSDPTRDDILGALSLIIWSLMLVVTVKYVLIVLQANDHGEGGTFALYSLLSRHAHIIRRDPREMHALKMERVRTTDLKPVTKTARNFLERSSFAKNALKVLGVFGVAFVMSDGILTPSQSILGAVQGLEIVKPDITKSTIVGTTCGILILLFLIQPFGTTKVASAFAPIVIIWLLLNAAFGIYNLAIYDASVLKAFSPYFAGEYFMRNKTDGWRSLGGILLAFTGVEALFADMGSFTKRAIQLSWLCFAFPCLLLGYIGQAAYIMVDRSAWSNPFYNTVPPGMLYPSLVIAILAAIVASQAMITAVFQLLSQMMKLSYSPQFKLVHTSLTFYGQVYIPAANWTLLVGTIVVTAAFNNTTSLGHAYGICVLLVTFITTLMVTLVALIVWRLPIPIIACGFIIFAFIDCVFLSSSLVKIAEGAWVTLALAALLASLFILWRYGKETQWRREGTLLSPLSSLLDFSKPSPEEKRRKREQSTNGKERETAITVSTPSRPSPLSRTQLNHIGAFAIFFDKSGSPYSAPAVFAHFVRKFHACPQAVIFLHLRPLPVPTVPPEDRYHVARCFGGSSNGGDADDSNGDTATDTLNGFRLIIRHGYTDEVVTHDLGMLAYEQVRNFIVREACDAVEMQKAKTCEEEKSVDEAIDTDAKATTMKSVTTAVIQSRHSALSHAYNAQVVYVIGNEQLRLKRAISGEEASILKRTQDAARRLTLAIFLWLRENARTKVGNWDLEVERVVEVGYVCDI